MEDAPNIFGDVLAWLYAFVWILVLVFVFLPVLVVGYVVRGIGTVMCNGALKLRVLMEHLGEQIG